MYLGNVSGIEKTHPLNSNRNQSCLLKNIVRLDLFEQINVVYFLTKVSLRYYCIEKSLYYRLSRVELFERCSSVRNNVTLLQPVLLLIK